MCIRDSVQPLDGHRRPCGGQRRHAQEKGRLGPVALHLAVVGGIALAAGDVPALGRLLGLSLIHILALKENILRSQRVERFTLEVRQGGQWKEAYQGTVVGYKKLIPLEGLEGDGLRVTIQDARVCPTLAFWGVY